MIKQGTPEWKQHMMATANSPEARQKRKLTLIEEHATRTPSEPDRARNERLRRAQRKKRKAEILQRIKK